MLSNRSYNIVECKYCSKSFAKCQWQIRKYPNHYCSRECYEKSRSCYVNEAKVVCKHCSKTFSKLLCKIKKYPNHYCSTKCAQESRIVRTEVICKQCSSRFSKTPAEIKRSPNHFCSKSCAAIYNNAHKKHGTRRSKLEVWLEKQLLILYPQLKFHFNRKDTINSELDIYIPSLKLAFELNGIYHYEPIHGQNKLDQIQNNDHRKFQACLEQEIELCIIDSSSLKYFKPANAQKYLDIVCEVVDQKLQ
jgi:hypothetical protein